jgi:hypothetical protein
MKTEKILPGWVMDILLESVLLLRRDGWILKESVHTHTHSNTPTRCYLVSISHQTYHHLACVCVCVYRNEKAGTFRSVFGFSHFQKMEFHYYFVIAIDLSFLKLKKTKNDEFETFTLPSPRIRALTHESPFRPRSSSSS